MHGGLNDSVLNDIKIILTKFPQLHLIFKINECSTYLLKQIAIANIFRIKESFIMITLKLDMSHMCGSNELEMLPANSLPNLTHLYLDYDCLDMDFLNYNALIVYFSHASPNLIILENMIGFYSNIKCPWKWSSTVTNKNKTGFRPVS